MQYKTEDYRVMIGFMYFLIVTLLFIALLLTFVMWFKAPILIFPGITFIVIIPYFFEKKIKALFTKNVILEFDNVSFSMIHYNKKDNTVSKQLHLSWNEIKSYCVYFSPAKNTILILDTKNGQSMRWIFKDNKSLEEAINSESLFKTFFSCVKQYNSNKDEKNKIKIRPSFLNGTVGTAIFYFEIVLIIFAFIFHLTMHPQSSILTLFIGVGLTLQQYFKRKNEKEVYEKISKLS